MVPPSQADLIVEALEAKGLPYAYLLFEGEQHGFRKAENIQRSLEAELVFYGAILGFEPADDLPPLDIRNLRESRTSGGGAGAGLIARPPPVRGARPLGTQKLVGARDPPVAPTCRRRERSAGAGA